MFGDEENEEGGYSPTAGQLAAYGGAVDDMGDEDEISHEMWQVSFCYFIL